MKAFSTCALALAAAGLLSACGGGEGSGGDPAHFSGKNDRIATRISGATTIEEATTFTAEAVGINRGEENELADGEDIAFRIFRTSPDAVPTFVVTFNGETTTFGPEHVPENRTSYRIEGPGDTDVKRLVTWWGTPLEHADGRYWGDWTEGRFVPLDRKHHFPVFLRYEVSVI